MVLIHFCVIFSQVTWRLQARKNFAKFYFLSIEKKNVLKWKIAQNYKTRNFSKFIDIYNIIIEFNTRDGISCQ